MNTSELVTTIHLSRKTVIYIRQSTPHQVLTNQESLSLQYALKERALVSAGETRISRLSILIWAQPVPLQITAKDLRTLSPR